MFPTNVKNSILTHKIKFLHRVTIIRSIRKAILFSLTICCLLWWCLLSSGVSSYSRTGCLRGGPGDELTRNDFVNIYSCMKVEDKTAPFNSWLPSQIASLTCCGHKQKQVRCTCDIKKERGAIVLCWFVAFKTITSRALKVIVDANS